MSCKESCCETASPLLLYILNQVQALHAAIDVIRGFHSGRKFATAAALWKQFHVSRSPNAKGDFSESAINGLTYAFNEEASHINRDKII